MPVPRVCSGKLSKVQNSVPDDNEQILYYVIEAQELVLGFIALV